MPRRRAFRPVMIAICAIVGWHGFGAEHVAAEESGPDIRQAGEYSDFLFPENAMRRGCTSYPSPGKTEPVRSSVGESGQHYCVAEFVETELWKPSDPENESWIGYTTDTERNSRALAVRFGRVDGRAAKVEFRLASERASRASFEKIDSVRLWVKGNGSSAQLRVWLVDRDGEAFTHQKPLRLNFSSWALEDLSFAPGYVLSHGKHKNGILDPPLTLRAISVTGSPQALRGEIRIDRLSVTGLPWAGAKKPSAGAVHAEFPKSHESPPPVELYQTKRVASNMPLSTASTAQANVSIKNNLEAGTVVRFQTTVHRVLGETLTQETAQKIDAGTLREVPIPIKLAFPGWYRAVTCVHVGDVPLSCMQDEYFVWEPAGNDEADTPPTFPGAMMSADLFLGGLEADLQVMRQAGVKVLRFPFRWEKIEPKPGEYNWRPYDTIFELCHRANIIPQPMVVQTPDWARRAPYRASQGKAATSFTPPEDMMIFGKFMEKAAGRYAKYSPYWEIWNEPISRTFWAGGSHEDYVALLQAGYNGVKTADSRARVLSAGAWAVDGAPESFSRHLMEKGRNYFDILAAHSHGGVHRVNQDLDDFDRLWANAKDRPPVWLNETGVTVDPRRPDGELLKAAETVKKMVTARARGVENYGWFIFKHMPNSYRSPYNNYSVMDERGGPRPALLAYNNAVRWLRKTRIDRVETATTGYAAYEFSDGARRVLVAWGKDPEISTPLTRLPIWAAEGVDVYNMFGGPVTAGIESKSLTIMLAGNPVFLVSRNTARQ